MSLSGLSSEPADAHADQQRWENREGWAARHISDTAPFSLWDEENKRYRMPKGPEYEWCREKFGDGTLSGHGWFIAISTSSPSQPAPFTLGGMPLFLHPPHENQWLWMMPRSNYAHPRVANPCPEVKWEQMAFPTKDQNAEILTALEPLANVHRVIYMPYWTLVELEIGDGREYKDFSLPGTVGGRTTLYHHAEEPFLDRMKGLVSCPRLKGADSGNWFEIGGDEAAMLTWAEEYTKPRSVLGDGEVGVGEWERRSLCKVFGDVSGEMRGVPIVRCKTGEVVGECDVTGGVVECISFGLDGLDGLDAEGWVVM
ncbi:hypothetical protein O988_03219 [Pseudogymnoascus sp. VKM F-3808]|nr:hypothetical protein O988_03219 [Pseudogymnoascus sp. VKM F-3808]